MHASKVAGVASGYKRKQVPLQHVVVQNLGLRNRLFVQERLTTDCSVANGNLQLTTCVDAYQGMALKFAYRSGSLEVAGSVRNHHTDKKDKVDEGAMA
jgi:hypothetical protein